MSKETCKHFSKTVRAGRPRGEADARLICLDNVAHVPCPREHIGIQDRDIRAKALDFRKVLGDIHGRVALDKEDAPSFHLGYAVKAHTLATH